MTEAFPSPMKNLVIRLFEKVDYASAAEIYGEIDEDLLASPEVLRDADRKLERDSRIVHQRWVATAEDGKILGHAVLTQDPYFFHPRQFVINIWVRPLCQRQGIGQALYDTIQNRLKSLSLTSIRCPVGEKQEAGLRFLSKRGFTESYRLWKSVLDVRQLDPRHFRPTEESPNAAGIQIKTLREVESDPHHRNRIHDLTMELDRDIPMPDDYTPMDFEAFWKSVERDLPSGEPFYVAVHQERYVGLHFCFFSPDRACLHTAHTGILPSYRERGIATALKLKGIEYAIRHDVTRISTWNDSRNLPMLSLNGKLGFIRKPATIHMQKNYGAGRENA